MVHLKLDWLDIDVVDHRALPVNTRGKKCFFAIFAVHHVQPFCYHGRTDRRDIGVAALRTTFLVLRQTQSPWSLDFLISLAWYVLLVARGWFCLSFPNHTPLLFKWEGVVINAQFSFFHFLLGARWLETEEPQWRRDAHSQAVIYKLEPRILICHVNVVRFNLKTLHVSHRWKVLFSFFYKFSQGFYCFLPGFNAMFEEAGLARSGNLNCRILSIFTYFTPVLTLTSKS